MRAEATGLKEKLEAMQKMEGAAREHEEFRLKIEAEQKLRIALGEVQMKIAEAQAKVLAQAFASADIKIVGGDGQFLDKLVQAASVGQMVDGFIENSGAAKNLLAPYLSGEKHVGDTVKDVITAVAHATNGQAKG